MFGVAEDIDLFGLVGRTLERISVGAMQFELGFDAGWLVRVECGWRLNGDAGEIVASEREELLEHLDELKALVGATAIEARPVPPDRIEIDFGTAGTLVLIDDSEMLESLSIEPIGIVV